MPISQSKPLFLFSQLFVPILVGFGINSILRPRAAYLMLGELPLPSSEADRKLIDSLMIMYGAKELVQALAIYLTGAFASRKALGWLVIASCGGAFVDGWVVKQAVGTGEWNHWGYASMFTVVGALLTGILG